MQTFLPSACYQRSAAWLDSRRLNKQIVEGDQILHTLCCTSKWKNHPAVRMWKGFENSLCHYIKACHNEFVSRGGRSDHKSWLRTMGTMIICGWDDQGDSPEWVGDEEIHSSHRARLLLKGELDRLEIRAKILLGRDTKQWFSSTFGKPRRDLNVEECTKAHESLDKVGIQPYANWYEQFGWTEQPSYEYVWPVKLYS